MIRSLLGSAALIALVAGGPAVARDLDPNDPADAVQILKRIQCGPADGEPAVYHWSGHVYSRVPGEPDKLLFDGEGMNIRQCVTVRDPERGVGFRRVSREVMLFTDPETGKVLRKWTNPWTDDTVDVVQIANDPVNGRPTYPKGRDGKPISLPIKRSGDWVTMPIEVPLFYTNPLAGDYQAYVGNKYHAMEIFDFADRADDLLDTDVEAHPSVSWVRIAQWMPWMKMGSRPGHIVFNATGTKLDSFDSLPAVLKNEIKTNYPKWTSPPPTDDQRPNATTWTVFKKRIDAKRRKEK